MEKKWNDYASLMTFIAIIVLFYCIYLLTHPTIITKEIQVEVPVMMNTEDIESVPETITEPIYLASDCPTWDYLQERHESIDCPTVQPWECERGSGGWNVKTVEKKCKTGQTLLWDCTTQTSSLR